MKFDKISLMIYHMISDWSQPVIDYQSHDSWYNRLTISWTIMNQAPSLFISSSIMRSMIRRDLGPNCDPSSDQSCLKGPIARESQTRSKILVMIDHEIRDRSWPWSLYFSRLSAEVVIGLFCLGSFVDFSHIFRYILVNDTICNAGFIFFMEWAIQDGFRSSFKSLVKFVFLSWPWKHIGHLQDIDLTYGLSMRLTLNTLTKGVKPC